MKRESIKKAVEMEEELVKVETCLCLLNNKNLSSVKLHLYVSSGGNLRDLNVPSHILHGFIPAITTATEPYKKELEQKIESLN